MFEVGTNLIRRVIDNKYTALITTTEETSRAEPIFEENASNPSIGSGAFIKLNVNEFGAVLTEDKNGNIHYEEMQPEITLGHELIHGLRYMGGNRIASKKETQLGYVNYSYAKTVGVFARKKQYFVEKAKMEELATVGISYIRPDGSYANAATWVTTENALRNEHGYNKRVRY